MQGEFFVSVNSGRPGSVGDSLAFRKSSLKRKIDSGKWLHVAHAKLINGQEVRPFLVTDSAFLLSPTVVKLLTARQKSFNYAVIRTRRFVAQAFGRLKGEKFVLRIG